MPNRIDDLLRMAMSFGASDLHLRAGSVPIIRVHGELRPVSGVNRLDQEETLEMAFSMMSNHQKLHFRKNEWCRASYGCHYQKLVSSFKLSIRLKQLMIVSPIYRAFRLWRQLATLL